MRSSRTPKPPPFDSRWLGRRRFLGVCAGTALATTATLVSAAPEGYTNLPFAHGSTRLDVWTKGNSTDPLVFVLHDMVGLRQGCFDLGDALVAARFSVAIPRFFGDRGGGPLGYLKACGVGSNFRCYDPDDYGPIVPWIKALAHDGSRDREFGAIGNCMTGVLPLVMLRSERCVAPVLCQPAFPFRPGLLGNAHQATLGLSEIDLDFAALRTRRDRIPVLGVRYQIDSLCRPERFCSLGRLLGDQFHRLDLPGEGHSTLLGEHRSPLAFKTVLAFLQYRLKGVPWSPPDGASSKAYCAGAASK